MPNCTSQQMLFGRIGRCEIEANFEGGALSSDGGLMLVRQVDRRIGLTFSIGMGGTRTAKDITAYGEGLDGLGSVENQHPTIDKAMSSLYSSFP